MTYDLTLICDWSQVGLIRRGLKEIPDVGVIRVSDSDQARNKFTPTLVIITVEVKTNGNAIDLASSIKNALRDVNYQDFDLIPRPDFTPPSLDKIFKRWNPNWEISDDVRLMWRILLDMISEIFPWLNPVRDIVVEIYPQLKITLLIKPGLRYEYLFDTDRIVVTSSGSNFEEVIGYTQTDIVASLSMLCSEYPGQANLEGENFERGVFYASFQSSYHIYQHGDVPKRIPIFEQEKFIVNPRHTAILCDGDKAWRYLVSDEDTGIVIRQSMFLEPES